MEFVITGSELPGSLILIFIIVAGCLLWIDPGRGHRRLGGSAYCQANGLLNIPFEVPDVDSVDTFVGAFQLTQRFLDGTAYYTGAPRPKELIRKY